MFSLRLFGRDIGDDVFRVFSVGFVYDKYLVNGGYNY